MENCRGRRGSWESWPDTGSEKQRWRNGGKGEKVSLSRTRLGWNQTAAVIIDLSASLHFVRDPYKCGKRHERVVTSIVHGLHRSGVLYAVSKISNQTLLPFFGETVHSPEELQTISHS